jgi:hypothetical protein
VLDVVLREIHRAHPFRRRREVIVIQRRASNGRGRLRAARTRQRGLLYARPGSLGRFFMYTRRLLESVVLGGHCEAQYSRALISGHRRLPRLLRSSTVVGTMG